MTHLTPTAKRSLLQHLRTEQLLGVRSVPMVVTFAVPPVYHKREAREPLSSAGSKVELGSVSPPPLPRGDSGGFVPRPPIDPATAEQNAVRLRLLDDSKVKNCTRCELHAGRTQTVFGQGSPSARIVFVGEGPGYEEDKQGLAFVGPAGLLLTKMIAAMGLSRDEVFICNVVKCRPPGNRTPAAEEILACSPYLHEQLAIIRPEMIVALGAPAAKTLLNTAESIGKLRGRFHQYHPPQHGDRKDSLCPSQPGIEATRHGSAEAIENRLLTIDNAPSLGDRDLGPKRERRDNDAVDPVPLMPTYHPAYLLRNPDDKRKVWEDLQLVMARMGLKKTPE